MISATKIRILIKELLLTTFFSCVLLAIGNFYVSIAQETFKIQNVSNEYDVVVQVETTYTKGSKIDSEASNGPAKIYLLHKGKESRFQVINISHVEIYRDAIAYNPKINAKPRGIYAEEYSIVFEDFNFDGSEDLAVCNGRSGGYGGPSYNIYLFNKKLNKFIYNKALSHLTIAPYL